MTPSGLTPLPARIAAIAACAAVIGAAAYSVLPAEAHDLAETSATLILREAGHVELRLQIPWADVLHAQWIPAVSTQEFLVRVTAQRRPDFARELAKVQATIERGTKLTSDRTGAYTFPRWQWPEPGAVQEALRRELMSRLADGDRFEHASRLSAVAEHRVAGDVAAVRLQLPPLLGPTLLTVYRPSEQWLKAGELSAPVPFRRPVLP